MEKRTRSPNYPAFGLSTAIEKARLLYESQQLHAAPREVVAKGIGYNSLNGASATAISAMHKYGLLEKSGQDIKLSERAMQILHPQSKEERSAAMKAAAVQPSLFAELAERFPGKVPNDELLRNYLIRNRFAPSAVSAVILAYRETMELVDDVPEGYDSPNLAPAQSQEPQPMQPSSAQSGTPVNSFTIQKNERLLGQWEFEGGGHVRIVASGDVDTGEALDMVDVLVGMRRKEVERRIAKARQSAVAPAVEDAETENDA